MNNLSVVMASGLLVLRAFVLLYILIMLCRLVRAVEKIAGLLEKPTPAG